MAGGVIITADDVIRAGACTGGVVKVVILTVSRKRVQVLKEALMKPDEAGIVHVHRAAAILRVLRVLMAFAVNQDMIAQNPVEKAGIPTPPSRTRRIHPNAVDAIVAAADDLGTPAIGLGVTLGLWTLQRQGDILRLTQASWREITDISDDDRTPLVGRDGRVMGFRLKQQKTGEWVEIALFGAVRERVEAAIAANRQRSVPVTTIVADTDEARGYPQWKFQRGFRAAVEKAVEKAKAAGDDMLVEQLTGIQFRDLRRTGMCLMGDLGIPINYIASVSGHDIDRTKKILQTYMPANTRTSAAGIAMLARKTIDKRAARPTKGQNS